MTKTLTLATTAVLAAPVLALVTGTAGSASADDPRPAPAPVAAPVAAPEAAPTTPAPTRRPVLQVDDTEQERRAIWDSYNLCLLDHGAAKPTGPNPVIALGNVLVDYPGPQRAQDACRQLEPVQPPALDAATNPRFEQQADQYVTCLRDGGLWVERLNDENIDWTYSADHPVPDDSAKTEQRCLVEVFAS
jgi:hypothetical protein